MINHSFKVVDLKKRISYVYRVDENGEWISTKKGGKVTQEEVQSAYDYFSSHWQDYDVDEIKPKQTVS